MTTGYESKARKNTEYWCAVKNRQGVIVATIESEYLARAFAVAMYGDIWAIEKCDPPVINVKGLIQQSNGQWT